MHIRGVRPTISDENRGRFKKLQATRDSSPSLAWCGDRSPIFRLQNCGFGLYSDLRSEFLKLRRWSLGLHRWMRGRTRQGEPGDRRNFDLRFSNFDCLATPGLQSPIENRHSKIEDANPLRSF